MKHARDDYQQIQDPSGKIPEDEPVFLLRSCDVTAPQIVEQWADLVEDLGGDADIVQRARGQAEAMRVYGDTNGSKVPGI